MKYKVGDVVKVRSDLESENKSWYNPSIEAREKERKKIKKLIKLGYEVIPSKTNHYVTINGETFNGWTIEEVNNIINNVTERN